MESPVPPTMDAKPPLDYASLPRGTTPRWMAWTGRALGTLVVLMMGVMPLVMLVAAPDEMKKGMAAHGFPLNTLVPIVVVEVACAVLYAIPRTSMLGAILIVGYLGGAVATHVRGADGNWPMPIVIGLIAGLGLWLRDPRVRALVPWRRG